MFGKIYFFFQILLLHYINWILFSVQQRKLDSPKSALKIASGVMSARAYTFMKRITRSTCAISTEERSWGKVKSKFSLLFQKWKYINQFIVYKKAEERMQVLLQPLQLQGRSCTSTLCRNGEREQKPFPLQHQGKHLILILVNFCQSFYIRKKIDTADQRF